MSNDWRSAAAGAVGGAVLALVAVYGLGAAGLYPSRAATERTVHDYLIAHPAILVDMTNTLQQQQAEADQKTRQAAIDKIGLKAFFDPKVAFVTGPADAKRTMVEFFDYNCPYCRASVPAVQKYYDTHKNTRYAFIEFPIKGDESVAAAHAAIAARRQPGKYLAFHFALMSEKGMVDMPTVLAVAQKVGLDVRQLSADMNDPAVTAEINAALKLADAARIDGTPTFIIDGKIHPGAVDEADLKALTGADTESNPAKKS